MRTLDARSGPEPDRQPTDFQEFVEELEADPAEREHLEAARAQAPRPGGYAVADEMLAAVVPPPVAALIRREALAEARLRYVGHAPAQAFREAVPPVFREISTVDLIPALQAAFDIAASTLLDQAPPAHGGGDEGTESSRDVGLGGDVTRDLTCPFHGEVEGIFETEGPLADAYPYPVLCEECSPAQTIIGYENEAGEAVDQFGNPAADQVVVLLDRDEADSLITPLSHDPDTRNKAVTKLRVALGRGRA